MRTNDEDRFFYEWQRHEAEQLARLNNLSREDAIRVERERKQAKKDAQQEIMMGLVLGGLILWAIL